MFGVGSKPLSSAMQPNTMKIQLMIVIDRGRWFITVSRNR
jgi:hypothetical protein